MAFERTIPILGISEKLFLEFNAILMIVVTLFIGYGLVFKGKRIDYGRYAPDPKSIFNIIVPGNIAATIITIPSFLIPIYAIWSRGFNVPLVNLSIVLMFVGHYFQRTFIYGLNVRGGKPLPLEMAIGVFAMIAFDGYLQSYYHLFESVQYPRGHMFSLTSILGGMFEYVSGANFFGEIVEWLGFALYAQSLPALAVFIGSASNIGPRAWSHHQDYLQKFKDYPKNRKALIPFVL
uniref:Steroid 5-alpha reductase C-terminal domain-containing protein n=1 Tax=Acrobeloides nanus TaxID=290746 RepID=A0A914CT89_9BILA